MYKTCNKAIPNLSPTKVLLKETLSGFELSPFATVACFLCTILNKLGNWSFNFWLPNHLSFQNLIRIPLSSLNLPRFRNWSFTPIRLDQKCESPAFLLVWLKVLFFRHGFVSKQLLPQTLFIAQFIRPLSQ